MRVKVTKLGDNPQRINVPSGSTVKDAVEEASFDPAQKTVLLNGSESGLGATLEDGDEITLAQNVEGGI